MWVKNTKGYFESLSGGGRGGDFTDKINVKEILELGSKGSSLAQINQNRFDTVTILKHFDRRKGWFGENWRDTFMKQKTTETQSSILKDITLIPSMRKKEIRFRAQGLMPNTRHYPFFDGVRVDRYCFPLSFTNDDNWKNARRSAWDVSDRYNSAYTNFRQLFNRHKSKNRGWTDFQTSWDQTWNGLFGQTNPSEDDLDNNALVSDANGVIEGVFLLPNNKELRFDCGSRIFSLYDVTSEDDESSASRAMGIYTAIGYKETRRGAAKAFKKKRKGAKPTDYLDNILTSIPGTRAKTGSASYGSYTYVDTVAQTFRVDNEEGIFLTKVGLFFETKDSDNLPIGVQILPVVNGYPKAEEYIPGGVCWKNPDEVTTSTDATSETIFELDTPVYLEGEKEYAISIITQSLAYNVWTARMGEFLIGTTDQKIIKQPSTGSLFLSQNGRAWEPSRWEDLKYKLYRAKFVSSGNAIIENHGPDVRNLVGDPLIFDSDDATVRVIHPNHGYTVGDAVRLLFDSDESYPLNASSIDGERTITAIDGTGYTFEADSSASSGGRFGGKTVFVQDQVMFNYMIPSIDVGTTVDTTVDIKGKFTTGRSLAGTETPYGKDLSFNTDVKPYETIFFDTPRMVACLDNEDNELSGNASVTLKAEMKTGSNYVSPIIDADRMSITTFSHVIDRQDSASTNGFNVPLTFVDETNPTLGSHLAKYVTRPVTLEEDATGIKILLAASKPTEAYFDVYYKIATESENLDEVNWVLIEPENSPPDATSPFEFYEYEYLAGEFTGTLTPFTIFQVKIVMKSTNSSRPPAFRDLRVITLTD